MARCRSTSAPFEADTDLPGAPVHEIELFTDQPRALIVARLSDVAPDGSVLRISLGMLNLAFRHGFAQPEPLVPGDRVPVRLELDFLGHRIRASHRLRLSLSTGYWPMIWPAARPFTLTVTAGRARLHLPVRLPSAADAGLAAFGLPLAAPGASYVKLVPRDAVRHVGLDPDTREFVHVVEGDCGEFGGASLARLEEIDLELSYWMRKEFRIGEDDPQSARASFAQRAMLRRGDWQVTIDCILALSATVDEYRLDGRLSAAAHGAPVHEREWTESIARAL